MSDFVFHEEGFRILRLAYYQIRHLIELSAHKSSMQMCKITVVKSEKLFQTGIVGYWIDLGLLGFF